MRPRILHVYKDYWPPIVGGVEKSMHWMAHGVESWADVTVLVCSRARGSRGEQDGSIQVRLVGEWGRFASAPLSPGFPRALAEEAARADIVHFHHPNPTGEVSWLQGALGRRRRLRQLGRKPPAVVVTWHSDIVRQKNALRVYAPVLRRFLQQVDVVLPTSEPYIESSPFLREVRGKCRVVPLGIPLDAYADSETKSQLAAKLRGAIGVPADRPLILFAGQFREYKGLPYLVEALASIEGACAVLVGDGPMRPAIEHLINTSAMASRVTCVGRASDDDLRAWYAACDLFVLPSHRRSEAFGLVQIEAMASGKPVISCRLDTGVPFINQHGITGLTVPPADSPALAAALRNLLADEPLRRRMGEAARARAHAEFSQQRMIERVTAVYRELLAKR